MTRRPRQQAHPEEAHAAMARVFGVDVEAEVALVLQHLDHVPNQDRVARQDQPPSQDQDRAEGDAHP